MPVPDAQRLHKGLGVRRPDLFDLRNSQFGFRLGITSSDDPATVLAKVLWQVEHAIRQVTGDPRNRDILRYSYNTPRDRELNALRHQGERLRLLADRRGRGWAADTLNKDVAKLAKKVVAHWHSQAAQPSPEAEVRELLRLEAEHARPDAGTATIDAPVDLFTQMIEDSNRSERRVLEDLLPGQELHFEVVDGSLVTVRTPQLGEYLCVFTRADLLAAYQRSVGAAPGGTSAKGRELLGLLARHPGVGLAVNPVVGGDAGTHWTAADVARRWPGGAW